MTQTIKDFYSILSNLTDSYVATLESYIQNYEHIAKLHEEKDERTKGLMIFNVQSHKFPVRLKCWFSSSLRKSYKAERIKLEKLVDGLTIELENASEKSTETLRTLDRLMQEMSSIRDTILDQSEKANDFVILCMDHWKKEHKFDFLINPFFEKREHIVLAKNEEILKECEFILAYIGKIIKRETVVPNKLFEKLAEQEEVLPTLVQNTRGIRVVNE